MMCSVPKVFYSIVLLGISFLICSAYETRNNEIKEETLRCYDCNSEYDPRCADPFNPYTIGIINCTDRKPPETLVDLDANIKPIVCRKLVQHVEGKTRVVRGCGYLRDERDDKACLKRSGTKNVKVAYCACTKSLCNIGHFQQRPTISVIFLGVILIAIKS